MDLWPALVPGGDGRNEDGLQNTVFHDGIDQLLKIEASKKSMTPDAWIKDQVIPVVDDDDPEEVERYERNVASHHANDAKRLRRIPELERQLGLSAAVIVSSDSDSDAAAKKPRKKPVSDGVPGIFFKANRAQQGYAYLSNFWPDVTAAAGKAVV